MPAVLDKDGHVFDLGRSHRFHTPGSFCHVHHQAHTNDIDYPIRT